MALETAPEPQISNFELSMEKRRPYPPDPFGN
jgi:hypothetical protein